MSNQIYDAFDSVSAGRELKEKTKAYLFQASARRQPGFVRYAAAAACLLFVLLGIGGYGFYMTPVAAISIDVNPSMEWEVNRLDRVVSVICYNQEAEHVAETLQLKHRKYDEALTELLTSREMSGYLAENAEVSISVAAEDEARSIRMQGRAAECAGEHCGNVSCHGGTAADRQAASEAGVSLGKYEAFLVLQELDPSITLDEISGMCMGEIQALIRAYQGEEEETDSTDFHHTGGEHCQRCRDRNGLENESTDGQNVENLNSRDTGQTDSQPGENKGCQDIENLNSQESETTDSQENVKENEDENEYNGNGHRHAHGHHHGS